MYDTTEIVESDARVVFALLQKYGIYSPGVRNARAVFFKEKEKTYSLLLFASKKAMTSPSAESMAKEILRELKSNYMDRKFYFLITADSSGSSMWPKKIQLD